MKSTDLSNTENEVYRTICTFVTSSEQARWSRLNTFLVLSSIFLAAWVTVYTRTKHFELERVFLSAICLPGLVFSLPWAVLCRRASKDLDSFHALGLRMEKWCAEQMPQPFHVSQKSRGKTASTFWKRRTSSMFLVTAVPTLIWILFACLLALSWIAELD